MVERVGPQLSLGPPGQNSGISKTNRQTLVAHGELFIKRWGPQKRGACMVVGAPEPAVSTAGRQPALAAESAGPGAPPPSDRRDHCVHPRSSSCSSPSRIVSVDRPGHPRGLAGAVTATRRVWTACPPMPPCRRPLLSWTPVTGAAGLGGSRGPGGPCGASSRARTPSVAATSRSSRTTPRLYTLFMRPRQAQPRCGCGLLRLMAGGLVRRRAPPPLVGTRRSKMGPSRPPAGCPHGRSSGHRPRRCRKRG